MSHKFLELVPESNRLDFSFEYQSQVSAGNNHTVNFEKVEVSVIKGYYKSVDRFKGKHRDGSVSRK